MFRIPIGTVSILLFGLLIFGASTATAGEPQEIIKKRNSETGGPYFNLNTQVKASLIFLGGEILPDEASMFTDECSDLTIHYVTYQKSTGTDQTVMESCAGGDKVTSDDRPGNVTWFYENEYVHVFAEVRSMPDKEEDGRAPSPGFPGGSGFSGLHRNPGSFSAGTETDGCSKCGRFHHRGIYKI
jgi:hypothetical protein